MWPYQPELAAFRELETISVPREQQWEQQGQFYETLIYDTIRDQGVCWCRTLEDAVGVLLRSGYFRTPAHTWTRAKPPNGWDSVGTSVS